MNTFKKRVLISLFLIGQLMVTMAVNAYELQYELMDESEIDARISYLEKQLSEIRSGYTYWHYGWSSIYAGSGALGIAKALDADNSADETLQWVSAAKSIGGLVSVQILNPTPVVVDYADFSEALGNSFDDKIRRLKTGEKLLENTAKLAENRYTLKPHALTIGVNLLGGAIIAAYGDSKDALASTVLGIISGEAAIWTQPNTAEEAWNSYAKQFNGKLVNQLDWYITPKMNGLEVVVNF